MKILFCIDDSQGNNRRAVKLIAELFKYSRPQILLLGTITEVRKKDDCLAELKSISYKLKRLGFIQVKMKCTLANSVGQILKEIKRGKQDLIIKVVPGVSKLLEDFSDLILDETTNQLLSRINVSLLVIKNPKKLATVLLCTDGQISAKKAVTFWAKYKKDHQPRVNILNVIPSLYAHLGDFLRGEAKKILELVEELPMKRIKYLYEAQRMLLIKGIPAKIKLREGHAAEEILEESKLSYDLIVMGFKGRRNKNSLGEQVKKVIQGSNISVLALKNNINTK